jgi:hypothetical protein
MQRTRVAAPEYQNALQRIRHKQQIIADLVSGRLGLLDAAVRFWRQAGEGPPARTDPASAESWCRTVIGWAHLALCDRPERADAVSDRLEQELESYMAVHGAVQLPA